ncbi:hypothetical protein BY996DRAFT_6614204 [Phakopsora pachyrhizi]|nr:hypothetical protein BY996DRAFT_6614204 [Phakopsora pachyrhizi]
MDFGWVKSGRKAEESCTRVSGPMAKEFQGKLDQAAGKVGQMYQERTGSTCKQEGKPKVNMNDFQ